MSTELTDHARKTIEIVLNSVHLVLQQDQQACSNVLSLSCRSDASRLCPRLLTPAAAWKPCACAWMAATTGAALQAHALAACERGALFVNVQPGQLASLSSSSATVHQGYCRHGWAHGLSGAYAVIYDAVGRPMQPLMRTGPTGDLSSSVGSGMGAHRRSNPLLHGIERHVQLRRGRLQATPLSPARDQRGKRTPTG